MGQLLELPKGNGHSKPMCFVPDNFELTEDLVEWTRRHAEHMHIESEFERFHDYEFRRKYTDWNRVWRNWVRKWVDYDYQLHPNRYAGH